MTASASPLHKPKATMYVDLAFLLGMVPEWRARARAASIEGADIRVDPWRAVAAARRRFDVPRVQFYDAAPADGSYARNRPLHLALHSDPGFSVHLRRSQEPPDYEQKEVDVQITVDMMRDAQRRITEHMVLLTGDHDFIPVIEAVRRLGIHVTLASFFDGRPQRALCQAVDSTIDLGTEPVVQLFWSDAAPEAPA